MKGLVKSHCSRSASAVGLMVLLAAAAPAFPASAGESSPAESESPRASAGGTESVSAEKQAGYEEMERALKLRLEKNQQDLDAAYQLGTLYHERGHRDLAEGAFRNALRIDSSHVPSLVNLGVVLNEADKPREALMFFDQALKIRPDDALILCNKGQALYSIKRYNDAVDLYRQAVQIDPKSQHAHYWMGVAFADAGIYREAIVEWRRVVEIDPSTDAARVAGEGIAVLEGLIRSR